MNHGRNGAILTILLFGLWKLLKLLMRCIAFASNIHVSHAKIEPAVFIPAILFYFVG
jgi:hypothetical protein